MKAPILNQKCIDIGYKLLQWFDPECRSGDLIHRGCDSSEIRASKENRIRAYTTECVRFQQLSQTRVQKIHEFYTQNIEHALMDYPHNSIPETDIPMFPLPTYESLLTSLYEKNRDQIDGIVETQYWNPDITKHDHYGIYHQKIQSLKTRFRITYANSITPYPTITLGWDTNNPQVLRINQDGMIVPIH